MSFAAKQADILNAVGRVRPNADIRFDAQLTEKTMYEVIFVRSPLPALQEAALAIFETLGLDVFEERESSNYPPENRYFIGHAANASLKVCSSDDDRLSYPYWAILEPDVIDGASQVQIPTEIPVLAEVLAASGLEIFVPSNGWSKIDWNGSGDVYGSLAG